MENSEFNEFLGNLRGGGFLPDKPYFYDYLYKNFNDLYDYLEDKEWDFKDIKEEKYGPIHAIANAYYALGIRDAAFLQLAIHMYKLWYEKSIEVQRRVDRRVHKGASLHQTGYCYEILGEKEKSWRYYFAAFIEDVLDERDYVGSQAYRALLRFNVPGKRLSLVAREAKKFIDKKEGLDPLFLFAVFQKDFIIPEYRDFSNIDSLQLRKANKLWGELKKLGDTAPASKLGSLLEDFSESLFQSVEGFIVRSKRGKSLVAGDSGPTHEHDYDLMIHNNLDEFKELGNYILVECKNKTEKVGYEEIARFLHTLHAHKCVGGVIISTKGVQQGRFNNTITRAFDQDGLVVAVFDGSDIDEIVSGSTDLLSMLRLKYETVRFGLTENR